MMPAHSIPSTPPLQEARALLAGNEPAAALVMCERLIRSVPDAPAAWQLQGEALLALGRLPEAIAAFDRCLALDARQVDALLLRAATRHALGQAEAALADYDRVLVVQPGNADAHHNAGRLLVQSGELENGLARYDKAIAIRPDFPEAINNRGVVLKKLRRMDEALEAFKLAVAQKHPYLDALGNRPDLQSMPGKDPNAPAIGNRAPLICPDDVNLHINLGVTLDAMGRHDEALTCYQHALAIYPGNAVLHNNRGTVLQAMGRDLEALVCYERALELNPDYPDALNNLGAVHEAFDRHSEAEASIRKALRIDPAKSNAHLNLSLVLLGMGQFEEGWREHEWRWKLDKFQGFIYGFKQPRWDGSQALDGKTILLTAEQGFGDSIQFLRYAQILQRRGARILLLVPRPLIELFAGSLPVAGVFNATADLPAFDFHIPLLSLPLALGTTMETIPAEIPYLKPTLSRLLAWQRKLTPRSTTRVGLVWAGNPTHANNMRRSLSLAALEPLLAITSCEFVVLQKDISAEDRRVLDAHPELVVVGEQFEDFSDTAAVMSMLDLVISVDTSVAHLAGAMGKPVWILIPPMADWRWLHDRADSPWYPTARLYRRAYEVELDVVIRQVAHDLAAFRPDAESSAPSKLVAGPTEALKAATFLHNNGQMDDAIAIYLGVLQIEPGNFDANHLLGVARRAQGRFAEAEELILRALNSRPNNLPALRNLARVQACLGKHGLAVETTARIIERDPAAAEAWSDQAVSLIALKRHDEALASLDHTLELKPDHVHALNNRGVVLMHLERHDEALSSLDRALALQPGFADAISNRGLALLGLQRAHDAVANYRKGLDLHPGSTTLLSNLGIAQMALNHHIEAIDSFRRILAIDPEHLDANWNLSLSLLAIGDYPNGWRQYEWRWKRVEMAPHKRSFHVPQWTGAQALAGRSLLIHFEQAFGDTVQFLRYVRPLSAAGARIILAVPEALRRLVQASFPEAGVFCGDEVLPPFDFHCPLLSLPLVCGTTLDTIPAADPPYLRPPSESLAAWKARLGRRRRAIRIGLVWSGNPRPPNRSITVELMRPLLDIPGTEFYGLQKDVREGDARQLESLPKVKMIGAQFADFGDTAAAISLLDLVISVDTSVAHLAGALGKPVWIILPFAADWRWLTDRDDSPWYPTARLFRHQDVHAQQETLRQVAIALAVFCRQPKK
ncbi:MAG: tetratricopeptide repeat protein [Sulfuritalea sp.]|nr:tetratricopeptide repeat protein [Sulfuritalea sp.]